MALTYDDAVSWNTQGTRNLYSGIRKNAILCEVITSYQPISFNFSDLYDAGGGAYYPAQRVDDNVYYFRSTQGDVRVVPYNGASTSAATGVTVTSQNPSGYLDALAQGKDVGFTLEAYS